MRLDADEYLEKKLILEIRNRLPEMDSEIYGVNLKRKQDRISLVASLTMCEVVLEGKVVRFEVKNALQEEQLNSERAGLLFHIRQFVKCADLELAIKLEKTSDDAPKVFLTDKEKYHKMVEKNPALENLRKKLDLDLA